jgi:hypothetical protein
VTGEPLRINQILRVRVVFTREIDRPVVCDGRMGVSGAIPYFFLEAFAEAGLRRKIGE